MQDTIIHGDSYELIKEIPDKSVDLIVTDTPYEFTKNKWFINTKINIKKNLGDEMTESDCDKCCYKLKKEPVHKWEKENKRHVAILGLRTGEGGQRMASKGCIVLQEGKIRRFKPLNPISDEFEEWYIRTRNIKLCELYYEPYNFTRTGCKDCPYAIDIADELDKLERLLPNERKQCEAIWGKVYDEYRRLKYRKMRQN